MVETDKYMMRTYIKKYFYCIHDSLKNAYDFSYNGKIIRRFYKRPEFKLYKKEYSCVGFTNLYLLRFQNNEFMKDKFA